MTQFVGNEFGVFGGKNVAVDHGSFSSEDRIKRMNNFFNDTGLSRWSRLSYSNFM